MDLTFLPELRVRVDPEVAMRGLMRACEVLTAETSIWRDGRCVLCDMPDSGGPLPKHESDCAVVLARYAMAAAEGY